MQSSYMAYRTELYRLPFATIYVTEDDTTTVNFNYIMPYANDFGKLYLA